MEQTLENYILILQIRKLSNVSNDSERGEHELNAQFHPVLDSVRHERKQVWRNRLPEVGSHFIKGYGNSFQKVYALEKSR